MSVTRIAAVAVAAALLVAGCGGGRAAYIASLQSSDPGALESPDPGASETPVNSGAPILPPDPAQMDVQLDSFFGPEAIGIYDAQVNGLYQHEAIEVGVRPGSPDEDPIDAVMAEGGAEVLIASLPYVLQARETKGADLVLVAQLFQRSGTYLVSPKSTPVTSLGALKGKSVGTMDMAGRSLDLTAALAVAGVETGAFEPVGGYDFVGDPSSIPVATTLRSAGVAALQATRYDLYPQLLEFPADTGESAYKASQLSVLDFDKSGDALASIGVYARASWLADPKHHNAMIRFLRATFAGYSDCADSVVDCAQLVSDQGNPMPGGHLQYSANEINALIWPNAAGIGSMPAGLYDATVKRLLDTGILATAPDAAAVDLSYAEAALKASKDVDLMWPSYAKADQPIYDMGEAPMATDSPDPNATDGGPTDPPLETDPPS